MSELGNKQIMAENIKRLMDNKGVMSIDICEALDIPASTFSYWLTAKTYPRIDKIEMMANYFGVSKSELVEEKTEKQEAPEFDLIHMELIEMFDKLSAEQKQQVLALLRSFVNT